MQSTLKSPSFCVPANICRISLHVGGNRGNTEPVLDETPGNGERTVENALCGGEEGKGIETVNMGTISEKWKQEKPIGHLQDETFRFVGTCVFEEKEVFVVDVLRHHWMKRLLDDVEFDPNTLR